jgi:hypothetical protein
MEVDIYGKGLTLCSRNYLPVSPESPSFREPENARLTSAIGEYHIAQDMHQCRGHNLVVGGDCVNIKLHINTLVNCLARSCPLKAHHVVLKVGCIRLSMARSVDCPLSYEILES